MQKGFDKEPVNDEKYIKTKRNLTATNRNFHDNGMLGEGYHCVCVISNINRFCF